MLRAKLVGKGTNWEINTMMTKRWKNCTNFAIDKSSMINHENYFLISKIYFDILILLSRNSIKFCQISKM